MEDFLIILLNIILFGGGFIFLIYWIARSQNEKKSDRSLKLCLEEFNITLSKKITVKDNELDIVVDNINKKLIVAINLLDKNYFKLYNYGISEEKILKLTDELFYMLQYDYSEILDYELVEDNNQTIAGRGLASTGGALLFGVAGAVVGSNIGNRNIKKTDMKLAVYIKINRLENPIIALVFQDKCNNDWEYQYAYKNAQELVATLAIIKEQNKNRTPEVHHETSDLDITAKMKKINELKELGLITEEEYENKRKQLLDNF